MNISKTTSSICRSGPNLLEHKTSPNFSTLKFCWRQKKKHQRSNFNRPLPLKRKTMVPYRSFGSSSDEVRVPSGHRTAFQPWMDFSMHISPMGKCRGFFWTNQNRGGDFLWRNQLRESLGCVFWSCTVVESKNYRCPQRSDVCVYRRV